LAEKRSAAIWIATCGGAGFSPVAPGTAGSLVGLGVVVGIAQLPSPQPWKSLILALAVMGVVAIGVGAGSKAEKYFNCKDPGQVVIDEVAGQMLTFLIRPDAPWMELLAGFLLFRAFDIVKPFPARRIERVPGGWGIMMDDVVAGAYSLVTLTALELIFKWARP
jgi:phosphatidylglycerophosphatase A